jgi:hypothetical protein
VFSSLFTRTVKARVSAEFADRGPFTQIQYGQFPHELSVSTRVFERTETGDRAIEPLYPSFLSSVGMSQVLSGPLYSQLKQALGDAINEKAARPAIDRALMQSDVWAAFDLLYGHRSGFAVVDNQSREHTDQLLTLLARFIRKLALTRSEIEALPDNYAAASPHNNLPALFDPDSGWIEVQWHPDRSHDHSVDYRRAARVFIKPASTPRDKQEFLNSLRNAPDIGSKLEAMALVIQNLLIDSDGEVVPSRITYDVQIRRSIKSDRGSFIKNGVEEYELSRRLLLSETASGGLFKSDENTPMYLPVAGNDYGFASTQLNQGGDTSPILGTLRARCVACHGENVTAAVFTFGTIPIPGTPLPPVAQLNPLSTEHALFVARRKTGLEDFRSLKQGWTR